MGIRSLTHLRDPSVSPCRLFRPTCDRYASISKMTATSTGTLPGRPAMATDEREGSPFSLPQISINSLVEPVLTREF